MIPKNMNGIYVGRCLNQHHTSWSGVQSREHIYGMRRACNDHQVSRLNRETLFSLYFFYENVNKALRSPLWTVLERCVGLRRAYDVLHGIVQFRREQRRWVWMAKHK